jgi:SAM-dependent methyltransferase
VHAPALIQPELTRLLGDVRGRRILDTRCGEDMYARYVAQLGADVVGIDGSEKMIRVTRERDPRIEFAVADLLQPLPFPDGTFDAVVLRKDYIRPPIGGRQVLCAVEQGDQSRRALSDLDRRCFEQLSRRKRVSHDSSSASARRLSRSKHGHVSASSPFSPCALFVL